MEEVPSDIYTKEYYLSDNEGYKEYSLGLDTNMHKKFDRALKLANIKKGDNVVDVGCGRGELVYYAAKSGASALGLDYSHDAIKIANDTIRLLPKEMQGRVKAEVSNIEKYSFDQKVDVFFMIDIIEHMHDWQLTDAFRIMHQNLNVGGKLIITTPNAWYEEYFQPIKRLISMPFTIIIRGSRFFRPKYRGMDKKKMLQKIFRLKAKRGENNDRMHVNVMSPRKLKHLLKDFQVNIKCEDHSLNLLSLAFSRWFGREIVAVATKE